MVGRRILTLAGVLHPGRALALSLFNHPEIGNCSSISPPTTSPAAATATTSPPPACGSGHFLIAAHRPAKRLAALRTGDEEPSPRATRSALREASGAASTARTSIPWPYSSAKSACGWRLWTRASRPPSRNPPSFPETPGRPPSQFSWPAGLLTTSSSPLWRRQDTYRRTPLLQRAGSAARRSMRRLSRTCRTAHRKVARSETGA